MRAPVRRLLALLAAAALAAGARARPARAEWPPITDRGFTIDLYQGAVLGSARVVGMGGASVALAEGSAGLIANPAAVAARPATSRDLWDWDWHFDWLTPQLGSDHDNNGAPTTETDLAGVTTGGLVLQLREWGIGVVLTQESHRTALDETTRAEPSFIVGHAAIARAFRDDALTLGLGIRTGTFALAVSSPAGRQELVAMAGASLEAGALWRPRRGDLRVGGRLALPVATSDAPPGGCDPLDCGGYILPERVSVPWEASAGLAWRFAPTPWNMRVAGRWRDERALVVAADVVLTGAVADGDGLEAFAHRQLQRSGRRTSVSVRAGSEYEWLPGLLRIRVGSYWEPGRFDEVPGRLHVTSGLEVRLFGFCFLGARHRARLTVTADGARGYGNGGVSVGLWH